MGGELVWQEASQQASRQIAFTEPRRITGQPAAPPASAVAPPVTAAAPQPAEREAPASPKTPSSVAPPAPPETTNAPSPPAPFTAAPPKQAEPTAIAPAPATGAGTGLSSGSQPSTTSSPAAAEPAQGRLGPGFDCGKATGTLAQIICADPELSRVDLAFNQAFWALYQDIADADRLQLREEDNQFLEGVVTRCEVPRSGGVPADAWRYRGCIKRAYEQQREGWIRELSGAALEETMRPLPVHIALERKLRRLGFLSGPVMPEGVYGTEARRAIVAWQESRGRSPTGLLGNADAQALQSEP